MIRLYLGKLINKLYKFLERWDATLVLRLILLYQRNEAYRLRKLVIKRKGTSVINSCIRKTIKEYSKQRFGTKAFWPYLALYTEIRGKFIEGWIPYDYYRFVLLPRLNPKPALYLNDQKTFDYRLFGDFALTPLFLFISGVFYNPNLEIFEKKQIREFMSKYNDLIVIKEEGGWGGLQVRIVHSSEFLPEELKKSMNCVMQPYIKQYKSLNDLYPDSVNTFRVNTFLKNNGSVIVKYVWLRFGSDGGRVDNLTSGGNYLFFNLNGKPEKLIYNWKLGFEEGERHKNTGYLFADIKIPMFQEMLNECINAHRKYPYLRLIAWDVCIDSSGRPRLLEWNANNPDFPAQEAKFGPLWKNDDGILEH